MYQTKLQTNLSRTRLVRKGAGAPRVFVVHPIIFGLSLSSMFPSRCFPALQRPSPPHEQRLLAVVVLWRRSLIFVLPQIFVVVLSLSSLLPVSTPRAVTRGGSWGGCSGGGRPRRGPYGIATTQPPHDRDSWQWLRVGWGTGRRRRCLQVST